MASSFKLPVVSKGITMSEIPGEIAVYFEIGNCRKNCPGCHSQHLQASYRNMPRWQEASVEDLMEYARTQRALGATAIVLMGGTTNGIPMETLGRALVLLSTILPVGVYSGAEMDDHSTRFLMSRPGIRWLKVGGWDESKGGLDKKTTNQRFFRAVKGMEAYGKTWYDQTHFFQKGDLHAQPT